MRSIRLDLKKPKPLEHLKGAMLDKLVEKYRNFLPGIRSRLETLFVYPKLNNKGSLPASTPHENAVKYAIANKLILCVGYIIRPDRTQGGFRLDTHSWCIDDKNRVHEPTKGIDWNAVCIYCGMRVPEGTVEGLKYLDLFEREKTFNPMKLNLKG